MPQVKELKELNVAGLATTRADMAGPFFLQSMLNGYQPYLLLIHITNK